MKNPKVKLELCKCAVPRLKFERFDFERSYAYRGVCTKCSRLRTWRDGKNYKLIETATCSSQKGGDK